MSEDSIKYLGKSIHKYRKLKGMTQGKLAEFSDISVTFLSKLERAESMTEFSHNGWKQVGSQSEVLA